jgi:outer membrane receptor for ferrienterochelin and colicins
MTYARAFAALPAAALALASVTAHAQSDDEQLLTELMAVVDEGTAVATQTRMNVDYVPGMVTVLEGDLLASLGARTVHDAMGLVPGVMSYLGNSGEPFLLVRGIAFPFNSGNVKVLVNSIAMSREGAGISSSVMHMPIEQVERIEFVRGPGSLLYGDFAYMGLLNIVTRSSGSGLFVRAQDDGNLAVGGRTGYVSNDQATRFSLTASRALLDDPEIPRPATGPFADGNDRRDYATLGFAHRGFSADLQAVNRRFRQSNGTLIEDGANALRLQQALELTAALKTTVTLSALQNDAATGTQRFRGDLYEGGGTLEWRLGRHLLVTKATYTEEQIDSTRFQPPPPPVGPPPPAVNRSDLERRYFGVAVQDQWSALDFLEFTLGARYDKREDLDDERVTPRLAAVLRLSDRHILKAQYAEGYRAPTFFELYPAPTGQTTLDLEPVATTELSYIHRAPQRVARLTLFHTDVDDMIFNRAGVFANAASAEANGVEAEFEQQLTPALKYVLNASFADATTTRTATLAEKSEAPAADWLGNAALAWRPVSRLLFSAHLNYVGERNSTAPPVDEDFRLALTATAYDVLARGLTLRASVRNATGNPQYTVVESPTTVSVRQREDTIASAHVSYEF